LANTKLIRRGIILIHFVRFETLKSFNEQKENAGAETEQHDGNAGGDGHGQEDERGCIKQNGQDSPAFHVFSYLAMKSNTMPAKSARELLLKLIFVACQYFLSAAEFQKGH
jgi:hypothetical protein